MDIKKVIAKYPRIHLTPLSHPIGIRTTTDKNAGRAKDICEAR